MLFRRWGLILGWCWAAAAPLVGVGAVNPTTTPDVFYLPGSTRKICQLMGDTDYQWLTPTENLTETRAGLYGTDLGVPFLHNGRTYVVFGDTWGEVSGDRDPIAYTTDTDPEDGLGLTFYTNASVFRPITIPGIAQGAFNVPLDGVSVNNKLYLYHSTDHSTQVPMGRSVLAVSQDDGWTFTLLYTLSRSNFINVSVNKVNLADWPGFPQATGDGLALFGSGSYRASNVRLAFQPAASIEDSSSLRYFAGLDAAGNPTWSPDETASIDLFNQPVVGELSVAYNKFLRRWIMLYNSDDSSRGINFRTACQPWGPWSANQVLLDPWSGGAYGNYFHVHWSWAILDNAQNPGREYEFGGEYGPYMFKELATGSDNRSTLYFTLSSWNPYVSLLMKTELVVTNSPVITRPPTDQQAMAGQSATFELTASAVGSLNYSWARNGTVISGATDRTLVLPSVSPADNGAEFRCRAANSVGAVTSSPVYLTVVSANEAPQPQILTPLLDATYAGGQTVSFAGAATDPEDGSLPAAALSWKVLFCHGNYTVPFLATLTGVATGAFTAPLRGETSTNVCFRLCLTARDSGGRETTVTRDVFPRVVTLTLQTEPPGLPLVLNGQALATPTNLAVVAGTRYALGITASSNLTASTYDFMSWSDGGATSHSLTVPETNLTLTASFRSPTVLVSANAPWKYLVTGSTPAFSWTAVGFNDGSWSSGPAQLGYGNGDEATVIGWGPNSNSRYVTTYFRHTFDVGDPSAFTALLVRLLRDDGAVVYLNGTEVFRNNVGGGAPIWAMLAPLDALPADETSTYYSTNIPATLLLPGANVVAVEVHQNSVGSTADLSFALELRGVGFQLVIAPPSIIAQPQDRVVAVGQSATFSVGVSGTAPFSYQWQLHGYPLPEATNASYAQPAARSIHAGAYSVVVSNDLGWAVSSNAALILVQDSVLGDNTFGQGSPLVGSTDLIAVAAGAWHNLGLRADGTVVAWGNNGSGQTEVPADLNDAVVIAAGGYHSLAIRANGTVVAWGADDYGQTEVPAGLNGVIGIAAGTWHSVALRADGTVTAWGDNSLGQTNVPLGLSNVAAVAAGGNHTLALKTNGTVVAWGENTGAEGNVTGQSVVPWEVTNVVAIGAGAYHSLAVKRDGTLVAWGDNSRGQCEVPAGLSNVVAAVGGGGHSVALRADGTVTAWGESWNGQCAIPAGLAPASGVAAGDYHTVVLLADSLPVPELLSPVRKGARFSALIQTLSRQNYALEYKDSLSASNWTALATNAGNGGLRMLSDPAVTASQRFYRLRQW